jgi:hypothetical protein
VPAVPAQPADPASAATGSHVSPATGSAAAYRTEGIAAPTAPTAADRVLADAIGRIRTTVEAGVPGLQSRIEDPELGSIQVLVSAHPGETIRAELIARDPAAARELAGALDRAFAAGATLPMGVDLHVRAAGAGIRATAAETGLGWATGNGHHAQPQADAGGRRRDDAPAFAFGRQREGGREDAAPEHGRRHRPDQITVTPPASRRAARPGSALDVRA